LAFVGWMASVVLSGAGYALATGLGADEEGAAAFIAGQTALWGGFLATTMLASRRFGAGPIRADFPMSAGRGVALRSVLVGIAMQLVVVPAIYLPVIALGVDLDVAGPAEDLFDSLSTAGTVVVAAAVVVGALIFEELIFRGVLLGALCRRFGETAAIWVSAVLFGLIHFQPIQFPALLAIGAALAWIARRRGGLGAAMWAHAGFQRDNRGDARVTRQVSAVPRPLTPGLPGRG
jgi:membrane protease YdiL (CAAX protease family)